MELDEQKFREKLGKILERSEYRHVHTFAVNPLIDRIIKAVKECEVATEAVAEEAAAVEAAVTEEEAEGKKPRKRR